MKIIFYINTIHEGGAERVITQLASKFADSGHSCLLVTSYQESWEYYYSKNVKRVNLFISRIEKSFIERNIELILKLRELIKNEKPDIVVSFMGEPNFRNIIANIGLRTKTVISIRNDPNKEYSGIIISVLAKLLFVNANGIVFQTREAKEWFPLIIQNKSRIIMNQVDCSFFDCISQQNRKDVVSVGRLSVQKNQLLMIEAFSRIVSQIEDNLIIYGEGELRTVLEKKIDELNLENRVFLPGQVDNIISKIKDAKLFILSSDYEGMPNALMEAMALGIPVLSSDCPCGGPKELLGEIDDGELLFKTRDIETLKNKMLCLINNEEDRARYSIILKEKASKLFEPETIYKEWETYLYEILNK